LSNNFVIIRKPDPASSPSDVVTQQNNIYANNRIANKEQYQLLFALIQLLNSTNGAITKEEYNTPEQAQEAGAVTLNYGRFLQTLLNFFLISFCLYIIIRIFQLFQREAIYNKLMRCRYCKKEISKKAIRCPMCTSFLDGREEQRIERWPPQVRSLPAALDSDNKNSDGNDRNNQIDIQRLALMEPVDTSTTRTLQQQLSIQRNGNSIRSGGQSPTSSTPLLSMHQ
jgi:large-conductance mechanosensitive channel